MRGCRSAVATTSMLMLPATMTRPMQASLRRPSDPDFELLPDRLDIGERRQSRFVAEPLDLEGRGGARKLEMIVPAFAGIGEIGIDVGAVEDVAGTVGVDHALAGNGKCRERVHRPGLVI